ncbi:uncharacterized protein [Palaemon carinicauda]|uniref:uncharacterized protein n=1 Tax=Palaemon carinicauda TaxID=392227 RepID=UPI0035B6092A
MTAKMANTWYWRCGLPAIIVFMDLLFIAYYFDSPFLGGKLLQRAFQRPQKQVKRFLKKSLPHPHKYFDKDCYYYDDFKARFICEGPYFNFTRDRIFDCAWRLWNTTRDSNKVDPWQNKTANANVSYSEVAKRPAIHIMLVGDSHMRYIFEVFVKRIANPHIKYRIASFEKDQWEDVHVMMSQKHENIHEDYHEVIHLGVPLRITYKWNAFLEDLPSSLESWIAGKEPRPTFLLFGTALHFMRETEEVYRAFGAERASEKYANQLKVLAPLVKEFAKTTLSVFKLLDHLQRHPRNIIANNDNIDFYNDIARETLGGNHLELWDSAQPLSDLYNTECQKYDRNTPETEMWICRDKRHIGYIMIEQYLNMYLNAICNKKSTEALCTESNSVSAVFDEEYISQPYAALGPINVL